MLTGKNKHQKGTSRARQAQHDYHAENLRTELRNAKLALNLAEEMAQGLRDKIARLEKEQALAPLYVPTP